METTYKWNEWKQGEFRRQLQLCKWEVIIIWTQRTAAEEERRDFPGGPVVNNLPSSSGDVGSIPGQGTTIPHAAGQLSPHAATTEHMCSGAHVPQRRPSAAKKIFFN